MANEQYLTATHTPVVTYQSANDQQSEDLPDWLNIGYGDLQERQLSYGYHTVTEEDIGQPDGIAYRYYSDSNWWWLIMSYNGIINPFTDLELGMRLKIPNLQQSKLLLQAVVATKKNDLRDTFVTI